MQGIVDLIPATTVWIIAGPDLGMYAPFVYYTKDEAESRAEDLRYCGQQITLTEYIRRDASCTA